MPMHAIRPRASSPQAGFTILEMMVAGTLSLMLSLVLFEIVAQSQHMADIMIMQSNLNGQARELFEMLGDGGVKTAGNPQTEADRVKGYHSRSSDEEPTTMDNSELDRLNDTADATTFRLRLGLVAGGQYVKSREAPSTTITCRAADSPLDTCDGTEDETVDGYVDTFNVNNTTTRSLHARLPEITFTLIDPPRVPKNTEDDRYIKREYSESYWTVFHMNVGP